MRKSIFIILCLEGAILSFNVAASSALIPSISYEFGTSPFFTGKLVWFYMLPYGVAALFYGPLVRFFEAKRVELFCFSLFSFANLLAGLSKNITQLFMARLLMGIFGASVIPLVLILIAHYTQSQIRGRLVGIFFSTTFIASLLGLFLSGVLPWRLIYSIPAILGFILLIFIYLYLPNFKPDLARSNFKINYLSAFKQKSFSLLFTYIFFISLFYHGIQQWLAVYFSSKFNLSQFTISMLITLTSLSGIFGEALGGWFSDCLGRLKTINLGIILMALSVFVLILRLPLIILAMIMIVWGLGWTFNHAGLSTLLTDLPKEYLFEAASLNSSVRFLSGGLGVAFSGLLIQRNFNLSFAILGICLLVILFFSKALIRI